MSRQIIDSIFDAAVIVGESQKIVIANESAHSILGYSAGELIGIDISQLIPDWAVSPSKSISLFQTSDHPVFTAPACHRSGDFFSADFKASRLSEREIMLVLRPTASLPHPNQIANLSKIADMLSDVVCVVSEDFSQISHANEQFEKIFDVPSQTAVISDLRFDSFIHPEDLARWLSWRTKCDSVETRRGEFRIIGRSGRTRWLDFRVCRADSFFPDQMLMVMADVTSKVIDRGSLEDHFRTRNQNIWGVIEHSNRGPDRQITIKRNTGDDRLLSRFQNHPLPTMCWRMEGNDFVLSEFNPAASQIVQEMIYPLRTGRLSQVHADKPEHIADIWRCHWERSNFHRQVQTRRTDGKLADYQVWYEYVAPDKVLDYWLDISEKCRAKRELEENLALSRTILDSLLEQIAVVDRSGKILDVNQPWRNAMMAEGIESFGLGMNYFDLRNTRNWTNSEKEAEILEGIHAVLRGESKQIRTEFRGSKDRWFALQATPLSCGEMRAVIAHRDITERKLAEQRIRESDLRFRELFRNSPLPTVCWKKTNDGFVVGEFNDEAIRVTNGEVLKTIGGSLEKLHASNKSHRDNILRSYETKSAFTVEDHWKDVSWGGPMGAENDVMVSYSYVPPDIVTVSLVIITERNLQQAALRESKERSRLVLTALSEGVLFLEPAGKVLMCNDSAARILGKPMENLVGASLAEQIGEDLCDERSLIYRADNLPWEPARLHGQSCLGIPTVIRHEDGGIIRLLMNAHPLNESVVDGLHAVVISFADVTVQWQAEKQMQSHQAELAHVARLSTIGEMAAMLAHELNQPLSAIVNFCQGCIHRLQKGEREGVLEAMQMAASEANRAAVYIRKIREFIRKREPHRSSVDLNDVVREVMDLLRPEARHLEIHMRVIPGTHLPLVQADSIQLEQVLLNLLRNSFDALSEMPTQDRHVVVETLRNFDGGVIIRVSDSGHGMSPEVMSKLFEPFNTTKPQGMGLGLTICRGIVESHGGKMYAEPNVVGGSVFTVELPENNE